MNGIYSFDQLAIMNATKTNNHGINKMNKATFKASDVTTFQDAINAEYNAKWEAYKKQSSGNTLYKKPVVNNNGFKLGLVACVPVLLGVIAVIF